MPGQPFDPNNIQANPQNDSAGNYNFNSQLRATNFAKDRDVVLFGRSIRAISRIGDKLIERRHSPAACDVD